MNPVRTCFLAILCLLTMTSFAAVPVQIPVQGYLTDATDAPVNGNVAITFSLFDSSSDPVALWVEAHPAVPVQNGIYTVHLGTITALTQNLLDNPELWLETTVNGETLTPRVRVASVPYALRSGITETITPQNLSQVLSLMQSSPDADGDGHTKMSQGGDDCDDLDPAVHAGAPEICDGKDNDCDGTLDEGFFTHWYADADADGFGNPTVSTLSCVPVNGYVNNGDDCDDTNPQINPAASEFCDGMDNNCDGMVDENPVDGSIWYGDFDGDGYGSPLNSVLACMSPPGYVADDTDCDDGNPSLHPGASEYCNGMDDDCDGEIDENPVNGIYWYADADGDGYGAGFGPVIACTQPFGYVSNWNDCNDSCPDCHPGAPEICDGLDNNCDGQIDEVAVAYYVDNDGDGYGNPSQSQIFCNQPPFGWVSDNTDCNDSNANVHPGATEVCDGLDNDCDGQTDPQGSIGCTTFYRDADNDGWGDAGNFQCLCGPGGNYTALQAGDCNDFNAQIHPGATELCNGIDDNCDGQIDNGTACPAGTMCVNGQCVPQ